MRIQCDVCKKEEAAVFCCADEASLCETCDRRVHRANKLAGKHRRFSLLYPIIPDQTPKCDVCQDKRAFLFCQEDRAILCRDCDASIHVANEHTMKHSRFLLTGVKLSSTATPVDVGAAMPTQQTENNKVGHQKQSKQALQTQSNRSSMNNKAIAVDGEKKERKSGVVATATTTTTSSSSSGGGGVCVDSSSISDYLINTLPGWCVDDLFLEDLTPSSSSYLPPTLGAIDKMGIGGGGEFLQWSVPQVLQPAAAAAPSVQTQTSNICFQTFDDNNRGFPSTPGQHQWNLGDDGFTVPQIDVSQLPLINKRSRNLWFT